MSHEATPCGLTPEEYRALPVGVRAKVWIAQRELDELRDAWFQDQTIAPDGELRATVSRTVTRAADAQKLLHEIHKLSDPNRRPE